MSNKNWFYYLIFIFSTWKIWLTIGWALGIYLIPTWDPTFPHSREQLIPYYSISQWPWANFDGVHYLRIALFGYADKYVEVFFPLYPQIIKYLSRLTGINALNTGLLLSHLTFFLSLYLLTKLLKQLSLTGVEIKRFLWILLIFPTSFYFASFYTESLFLFLTITTFLAAYQKKWWLAGIAGSLATATRFTGILLLPSLLIIWWQQNRASHTPRAAILKNTSKGHLPAHLSAKAEVGSPAQVGPPAQVGSPGVNSNIFHKVLKLLNFITTKFQNFQFSQLQITNPLRLSEASYQLQNLFFILLIPTGLIIYMIYLNQKFHDPLYFIHVQPLFSTHRTVDSWILWPQVIWRYIKMVTTVPWYTPAFFTVMLEFTTGIGFAILSLLSWKKLGAALGLYTILSYLLPTLTGSFSSLPRYVLVLFPAFIILTQLTIKHRWLNLIYQTFSPILLLGSIIYFTRGWWIA